MPLQTPVKKLILETALISRPTTYKFTIPIEEIAENIMDFVCEAKSMTQLQEKRSESLPHLMEIISRHIRDAYHLSIPIDNMPTTIFREE